MSTTREMDLEKEYGDANSPTIGDVEKSTRTSIEEDVYSPRKLSSSEHVVEHPSKTQPIPGPRQPDTLIRTKSAASQAISRVTSCLTSHSIKDPGPPPDGGVLAWTQAACGWLCIMNTWGFVNSFGAFQTH